MTPRMHARTIVPCALLLLACPIRPKDDEGTDSAAGETAADTTGETPAPKPAPAEPSETGAAAAGSACEAEIKALTDATAMVEQCVADL